MSRVAERNPSRSGALICTVNTGMAHRGIALPSAGRGHACGHRFGPGLLGGSRPAPCRAIRLCRHRDSTGSWIAPLALVAIAGGADGSRNFEFDL